MAGINYDSPELEQIRKDLHEVEESRYELQRAKMEEEFRLEIERDVWCEENFSSPPAYKGVAFRITCRLCYDIMDIGLTEYTSAECKCKKSRVTYLMATGHCFHGYCKLWVADEDVVKKREEKPS